MASQQTIMHGMQIPPPVLNVDLHVLPDFTGRVVLYIERGRVTCDRRLLDDEQAFFDDDLVEYLRSEERRVG